MCTGLEPLLGGALAGGSSVLPALALSLTGTMINHGIQKDYQQAVNSENQKVMAMEAAARDEESGRQSAMEEAQFGKVLDALEASNPAKLRAEAAAEAEDPENQYVAAAEEYNSQPLQGQISEGETGSRIGQIVADAVKGTKSILKAQSVLTSQGKGFAGMGDAARGMEREVANIASNRRGSLAASRLETSIPTAKITPSNSILGDALMLTGQMVGAGAGKKAGFGAKPTPAPTSRYWWEGGTSMN